MDLCRALVSASGDSSLKVTRIEEQKHEGGVVFVVSISSPF
jgi:hypothetical protein